MPGEYDTTGDPRDADALGIDMVYKLVYNMTHD